MRIFGKTKSCLLWQPQLLCLALFVSPSSAEIPQPESSLKATSISESFHRAVQANQDLSLCYDALAFADQNQDRRVDRDEFVTFIQLYGPDGFLAGLDTFEDLPLIFKSNFLILACLCLSKDKDSFCCIGSNAHIDNSGTYESEKPTQREAASYLHQVCFLTETSIDRVLLSMEPSAPPLPPVIPSSMPSTTASPAISPPSNAPTSQKPTTNAPTSQKPTTNQPTGTAIVSSNPTQSPSQVPSVSPSTAESASPTNGSPSMSPTEELLITIKPSQRPPSTTTPPSKSPDETPTMKPSPIPTATDGPRLTSSPSVITLRPSAEPTSPPSHLPSASHFLSATPSISSTTVPSFTLSQKGPPSNVPSLSFQPSGPTSSVPSENEPTMVDVVASATYLIAVEGNTDKESFAGDLELSMDQLATRIAAGLNMPNATDAGRRHLKVSVDLPTSLNGVIVAKCPGFIPEEDRCEDISVSIGLFVTEDAEGLAVEFENDLQDAILNNDLQAELDVVNPDSPVYIVSGMDDPSRAIDPNDENESGLSAGAISGFVVAGCVGLVLISLLVARRRDPSELYLKQSESVEVDEIQPTTTNNAADNATKNEALIAVFSGSSSCDQVSITSSGIAGDPNGQLAETKHQQIALSTAPRDDKCDDSSNAGSSGWSSHGGMSSLDTSSIGEDNVLIAPSGSASFALKGAGASLSQSTSRDSEPGIQMTYSELDQAIQQGDWAAVGVTAALLASQSYDTTQSSEVEKVVNSDSTLNPKRAAELDLLVEAGDWEGVVAAAAKYDAQASQTDLQAGSVSSRGGSSGILSSSGSVGSPRSTGSPGGESNGTGPSAFSGSGTGRSAFTSGGTTVSDNTSMSKVKKLEELRSEIELLVQHVVPEERDNVDEMMLQFRGREEELVETLRSMQERAVAQKSRVEGQKRAKRDARQTVEDKYAEETIDTHDVENTGPPADENWISEIDATPAAMNNQSAYGLLGIDQLDPPQEEDEDKEVKAMQKTLRDAIDNENWDVVAETASGLSGRYVDDTSTSSSRSESTNVSDRSQEINALVDKGDWDGVVAAASRFDAADKTMPMLSGSQKERRLRRQQRLKDEEEALAEADIWNAIAEQTKTESAEIHSGGNKAAKVAADWAIARSFSALNKATETGKLQDLPPVEGLDEYNENNTEEGAKEENHNEV